ncbi:MAG: hypothetical protein ACXW1C_05160, partial [Gallionella sp.]
EASYFRLVRPAHHGIMWPNEQDFSADTIVWDMQHAHADSALQANEITLAAIAAARSGNVQSFPNIHAPMADLNATEAKRS